MDLRGLTEPKQGLGHLQRIAQRARAETNYYVTAFEALGLERVAGILRGESTAGNACCVTRLPIPSALLCIVSGVAS